jgi:hypothetical protein
MHIHTKKQKLYFEEVIRLHYGKGYGEERICRILPIGHSAVSGRISVFASENGEKEKSVEMSKSKLEAPSVGSQAKDIKVLEVGVHGLRRRLKEDRMRADACEETINVAESGFKIALGKKTGAKRRLTRMQRTRVSGGGSLQAVWHNKAGVLRV